MRHPLNPARAHSPLSILASPFPRHLIHTSSPFLLLHIQPAVHFWKLFPERPCRALLALYHPSWLPGLNLAQVPMKRSHDREEIGHTWEEQCGFPHLYGQRSGDYVWVWLLRVWDNGERNITLDQFQFMDMGPLSGDCVCFSLRGQQRLVRFVG